MTYQRVEVMTGSERRRQYSEADKVRLVEEAFQPGVVASEVARRHGVNVSLLYRWRRQRLSPGGGMPGFAAVTVTPEPTRPAPPLGVVEVDLAGGTRVRITGPVDPALVSATLAALLSPERSPS